MFSKSCKYAIRAVLYLAINTHEEKKMGVEDLAKALNLPKHFLGKILQQLAKSRVISSTKGRNGGFYLNEKDKSKSLLEVIYTIEGPGFFEDCILGLSECSGENPCPYHFSAKKIKTAFKETFQNETIAKTAERINEHNFSLVL